MENYSVTVRKVPPLSELGQKVYFIEMEGIATFEASCKICDGTQKIVYRDREFPCPNCRSYQGEIPRFFVKKPVLREYIIYKIIIEGRDYKSAWTPKAQMQEENLPYVKEVYAFRRVGNGNRNVYEKRVPDGSYVDPNTEFAMRYDNWVHCVFTSPQTALPVISVLIENQKSLLRAFNMQYDTNYQYPEE